MMLHITSHLISSLCLCLLPSQPLTRIGLSNLWLTYHATSLGNMLVALNLPSVSIEDLRPGLPREQALVLSTTDVGSATASLDGAMVSGAAAAAALPRSSSSGGGGTAASAALAVSGPPPSLLTMEFRSLQAAGRDSSSGCGAATSSWGLPLQALRVRLQRPTLVLEFPFLIAVLNFVSPTPVLQVRSALPICRGIFKLFGGGSATAVCL